MATADTRASAVSDPASHERLVAALRRALGGDEQVALVQTHISSVLVTDTLAYKLKKPVALGFLDFSSLEKRRRACEDELRLNRRFAPALYLDVMPVTGTLEDVAIGGEGPAIEYAVRMRAFAQDALGSAAIARGALMPAHIDTLALRVADFHARAAVVPAEEPYGTPALVRGAALDNCREVAQRLRDGDASLRVDTVRAWTEREHARLADTFLQRREAGFVRECHGDLHLGNVALLADGPCPFDGIEFNAALRWIDVMSDVAFLFMDLQDRGPARSRLPLPECLPGAHRRLRRVGSAALLRRVSCDGARQGGCIAPRPARRRGGARRHATRAR